MKTFTVMATCAFGIESIVAREIRNLGYPETIIENGRVLFEGDWEAIARCNLWLRCADRVYIRMALFDGMDFDELFDGVRSVRWEEFIPEDAFIHVTGKAVKSKLMSVSDNQAIAKKAIIEAMQRKYKRERFPETGPRYRIDVSILKDEVTLALDTSGAGLHRRGYRPGHGEAPLRETLAAAIIHLSRWTPDRILADPFCGSGTIAIEAAMQGKNIAPGLLREFAAESWKNVPGEVWQNARDEAKEAVVNDPVTILASDYDRKVFKIARENAALAGVEDDILFQKNRYRNSAPGKNTAVSSVIPLMENVWEALKRRHSYTLKWGRSFPNWKPGHFLYFPVTLTSKSISDKRPVKTVSYTMGK